MKQLTKILHKTTLGLILAFSGVAGVMGAGRDNPTPGNSQPAKTGTICVDNPDLAGMQKELPRLSGDFNVMARLPLTGQNVYQVLLDSKNNITSCVRYVSEGEVKSSTYDKKRIELSSNSRTSTFFHEAFHARQDMNDGYERIKILTMKDAVVAHLLSEATAVGYQLAAEQEAKNHNITFEKNPLFVHAADREPNRNAFHTAYQESLDANENMDATLRETKALEAGGQAVVRWLMAGNDPEWTGHYGAHSLNKIKDKDAECFCDDGRDYFPGYNAARQTLYANLGSVSSDINLIPAEFLAADANSHINKSFHDAGLLDASLPPSPSGCSNVLLLPLVMIAGGLGASTVLVKGLWRKNSGKYKITF